MLVPIANREDPDLGLRCMSEPFCQATCVRNFGTFTIHAHWNVVIRMYPGSMSNSV